MKKTLLSALLLALFCFTGCEKDCDQWHEGKSCKTVIISRYYATYNVLVTDDMGFTDTFTMQLKESKAGSSTAILDGLILEFIDKYNFRIPYQSMSSGGVLRRYEGEGFFSDAGFHANVYIEGVLYSWNGDK